MRYLFRIGNFDNLICYLCTMIKIDIYGGLTELLTLSLPRVISFKFPLQPHQKYYTTQYEEIGVS